MLPYIYLRIPYTFCGILYTSSLGRAGVNEESIGEVGSETQRLCA